MVTPTDTKKIKRMEVEVNHIFNVGTQANYKEPYGLHNPQRYHQEYLSGILRRGRDRDGTTYQPQVFQGVITSGRLIREDDTWVDITPSDINHRAYWQCGLGHADLPLLLYDQWQNIQGRAIDASLITYWEAICATYNWPPWDLEFYASDDQRVYSIRRQGQPIYSFPHEGTKDDADRAIANAPSTPLSPYTYILAFNAPPRNQTQGWMIDLILIPAFGIGALEVDHVGDTSSTFTTTAPDNWQFHYETLLPAPLNRIHDESWTIHEYGITVLHRATGSPEVDDRNPYYSNPGTATRNLETRRVTSYGGYSEPDPNLPAWQNERQLIPPPHDFLITLGSRQLDPTRGVRLNNRIRYEKFYFDNNLTPNGMAISLSLIHM